MVGCVQVQFVAKSLTEIHRICDPILARNPVCSQLVDGALCKRKKSSWTSLVTKFTPCRVWTMIKQIWVRTPLSKVTHVVWDTYRLPWQQYCPQHFCDDDDQFSQNVKYPRLVIWHCTWLKWSDNEKSQMETKQAIINPRKRTAWNGRTLTVLIFTISLNWEIGLQGQRNTTGNNFLKSASF